MSILPVCSLTHLPFTLIDVVSRDFIPGKIKDFLAKDLLIPPQRRRERRDYAEKMLF
jgi:hypothetical protein